MTSFMHVQKISSKILKKQTAPKTEYRSWKNHQSHDCMWSWRELRSCVPDQFIVHNWVEIWRGIHLFYIVLGQLGLTEPIHLEVKPQQISSILTLSDTSLTITSRESNALAIDSRLG